MTSLALGLALNALNTIEQLVAELGGHNAPADLAPTVPFTPPVDLSQRFYDDFAYPDVAALDASGWAANGDVYQRTGRVDLSVIDDDPSDVAVAPGLVLTTATDHGAGSGVHHQAGTALVPTGAVAFRIDLAHSPMVVGATRDLLTVSLVRQATFAGIGVAIAGTADGLRAWAYGESQADATDGSNFIATTLPLTPAARVLFGYVARSGAGVPTLQLYQGSDAASLAHVGDVVAADAMAADIDQIVYEVWRERTADGWRGFDGGYAARAVNAVSAAAGAAALGVTLPA